MAVLIVYYQCSQVQHSLPVVEPVEMPQLPLLLLGPVHLGSLAEVAHSNLNNMGPDDGEEGLVYRVSHSAKRRRLPATW